MQRISQFFIALTLLAMLIATKIGHAQDTELNTVLVLSDSKPRVDIQVAVPEGTYGVLRLELINVSVAVLNASNEQVLTTTSDSIREIEIQFEATSRSYFVAVERLPNAVTGNLRVTATAEMSITTATLSPTVVGLTSVHTQALIPLEFSQAATGLVEIQRIENAGFTQILLPDTTPILTLYNSGIETARVILATGSYQLQMDNIAAYPTVQMQVETGTTAQTLMQPVTTTTTCIGTVNFERVNQRSGAGLEYTLTGEAAIGAVLPVGGLNTTGEWVLVGTEYGSAWMHSSYLDLAGNCANLPVY